MKVYYYDTGNIGLMHREWKAGRFPGHFLYGVTHLHKYGVDVVLHKHKALHGIRLALYTVMQVLRSKETFDAVYATTTNGLELLILLRAMKIFRHPIIVWQKEAITHGNIFDRLFFNGVDMMFFYSEQVMQTTEESGLIDAERMQFIHWGADLDFYDKIMFFNNEQKTPGFISTGKEKRDMPTLIRAFSATGLPLNIYIEYAAYGDNYLQILNDLRPSSNVHVNFVKNITPAELSPKVWASDCVVICLQETNYATGLTTLIEAMALGLPVICTKNPNLPIDAETAGIGKSIAYYNSVAWEETIRDFNNNPAQLKTMGNRARELAEQTYNLENCTKEVSAVLIKIIKELAAK